MLDDFLRATLLVCLVDEAHIVELHQIRLTCLPLAQVFLALLRSFSYNVQTVYAIGLKHFE